MDTNQTKKDPKRKFIHEANNHLAVIWGYVQMISSKTEESSETKPWIDKISHKCEELKNTLENYSKSD